MNAKNTSCSNTQHLHLCLVSRQPAPNIVPLLDPNLQVDEVVLLHTQNFKTQAEWLAKALGYYQIKSRFITLPHHENLTMLRDFFIQLMDALIAENENTQIYANLTSGTKPMSLALYEVALMTESDGTHAYYINMDDTLSWYLPKSKAESKPHPLEDRIKLTPFLQAHGWQPLQKPQGTQYPQWRPLVEDFASDIGYWRKPLTQLNGIAVTANNKQLVSAPIQKPNAPLKQLIDKLQKAELAQLNDNRLEFSHEDARFFCNGGWLEELVFHTLKQLSGQNRKIQDFALGLEIQSDTSQAKNELDGLVLVDNKLVIIECKTHNTKTNAQAIRNSLYKLDTLKDIGGVTARGLLITMHPPSKSDLKRAKQYQIPIIHGEQIEHLKTHLAKHL